MAGRAFGETREPSWRVRRVPSRDVVEAKFEGVGGVASLLPHGVNPDAFTYQQRYVDAIFRTLREVSPGDYDDYNIYLVQWLGSNVPRGIAVEGKTIDGVQHGLAYHLSNPQAEASDWVWEELGSYERVYDEKPDRDGYARHGMLLYVRKPAATADRDAPPPS